MAYLVSALFFSVLLAIANSESLYSGHPYNKTIGPYNLHTDATITIEYNANISICIVLAEFGLPAWTLYSEDICIWYFQWNSTGTLQNKTETVALLNEKYTIGIYYLDETQADPKHNATVEVLDVVQAVCKADEIFDNSTKHCLNVTSIHGWNETKPVEFKKGETKIFVWENPSNVGFFEFAYTPGAGLSSETMAVSYARFNGAPSQKYNDGRDTNGKITIATPKPGKWYFSLRALDAGKVTILFTGRVCGEYLAGKDCNIHVAESANIINLTLTSSSTVYFRVLVNKTHINGTQEASLLVSVATANSSVTPYLYASRGQIPDAHTADIKNCNRGYCDLVRSILYNSSATNEEWFIAIVPSVSTNVTAAVWFDSTCIPNCEHESHGLCTPSGLCDCEIDYEGMDCGHSKGLGPQYIVLIIIASLVVASAFIGFVAWAYMRQKRGAYEPLT